MKVELLDHMGDDLAVVNAARVSFSKESTTLTPGDVKLIGYLARGCSKLDWDTIIYELCGTESLDETREIIKQVRDMPRHWSPFAHTAIKFRVSAPIAIARQLEKHQAGLVWNEVSRRYVDFEPEIFFPDGWRKRAENVKQGSSEEIIDDPTVAQLAAWAAGVSVGAYEELLKRGVCPEQARFVLPQSMMTEWIWTGNLYAFANVCRQRLDSHAQREAGVVAQQISDLIAPLFPVSWSALTG